MNYFHRNYHQYVIFLFIAACIISNAGYAQQVHELNNIAEAEAKSAKRKVEGQANTFKAQASPDYRIHHLTCRWQVDPAISYIRGDIIVSFVTLASTDNLVFDLVDGLQVDSIFFRHNKISFSRPGNNTVRIQLSATLSTGTKDSLEIFYQGEPAPGNGFGSFSNALHSGTPVCWTLSEPYGARDWWPSRNGLDDKTDSLDVFISTPEIYTGVSNGLLQRTDIDAGWKTTHWKHRYPIATYLIALAATNYVVLQDTVQIAQKVMPVEQYVYPESAQQFRNSLRFTRRSLRIFNDVFGEYPFLKEKYGHTQVSFGGGMEHQTNSFMGNASEGLIVHEAAHQWFGDLITCGSWQDIWLNEGFAGFLTNFTTEKFYAKSLYLQILGEQLNIIIAAPSGSVFVDDTTSVARIFDYRLTYTKGAWLLHMLRWKMGDSAFFKGMRNYCADPRLAYGFAFSNDFIAHMEVVYGKSLEEYFKDWLYGQGYPKYQLAWGRMGSGWIQTELKQTTSHQSVDFFEMPVPVRFKNATRDTTIVIDHIRNNQRAFLNLGFEPDSAFIDPELKLISANNTVVRIPDDAGDGNSVINFPNPVITDLQLLMKKFDAGKYSITLYNNTGQNVWLNSGINISGFQVITVPMNRLPKGIYLLKIRGENGYQLTRKIIR